MTRTLRNRLLWPALILILLIGVAMGVLWRINIGKTTPEVSRLETVSLRLKWIIYSSFAHHLVAKDRGYYKSEGLNVEIRPGGAGIDPIKLVASGQDLVGLASYAQVLLAREKGVPIIAIAEEYVTSGVVAMSLADSGIKTPEDFIGKRVGWIPGSDTGTVYEAMMARSGVDRKKITEVPIGFDLGVFLNRQVDVDTVAYITNQPIAAESKGFALNIINPENYGITPGGNVFITSEGALRQRRKAVKGILRGSLRGIVESQRMPNSEVVDIVLRFNSELDRATEMKVWQATKDRLLQKNPSRAGFMSDQTWQHTAEIFQKYGGLEAMPSLRECFTNSLVEEIHREGL